MPNWCAGNVHIEGRPEDIEGFCRLLFPGGQEGVKSKEYFARSLVPMSWESFKRKHLGDRKAEFPVEFAWSCWDCLFSGYPDGEKQVTLAWACKSHGVNVVIRTEESDGGFEEFAEGNENGVDYKRRRMPCYRCGHCGETRSISRRHCPSDQGCLGCGAMGDWFGTNGPGTVLHSFSADSGSSVESEGGARSAKGLVQRSEW